MRTGLPRYLARNKVQPACAAKPVRRAAAQLFVNTGCAISGRGGTEGAWTDYTQPGRREVG